MKSPELAARVRDGQMTLAVAHPGDTSRRAQTEIVQRREPKGEETSGALRRNRRRSAVAYTLQHRGNDELRLSRPLGLSALKKSRNLMG